MFDLMFGPKELSGYMPGSAEWVLLARKPFVNARAKCPEGKPSPDQKLCPTEVDI